MINLRISLEKHDKEIHVILRDEKMHLSQIIAIVRNNGIGLIPNGLVETKQINMVIEW